jgi:hypothetical protein
MLVVIHMQEKQRADSFVPLPELDDYLVRDFVYVAHKRYPQSTFGNITFD